MKLGADTSYHNALKDNKGNVILAPDYSTMARRKIQFVMQRGMYGNKIDTAIRVSWLASATYVDRGIYIYPLFSIPIQDMFDVFAGLVEELKGIGEKSPALDIEWNRVDGYHNHPTRIPKYQDKVLEFGYMIRDTYTTPLLYSNPNHIKQYLKASAFSQFDLWIANWGVSFPQAPAPFTPAHVKIWQFRVALGAEAEFYGSRSKGLDLNIEL